MKLQFNINTLKEKKGVSYQKISLEAGIRYATLLKIKDNKITRIEKSHIERLLEYFKCSLNELISIKK